MPGWSSELSCWSSACHSLNRPKQPPSQKRDGSFTGTLAQIPDQTVIWNTAVRLEHCLAHGLSKTHAANYLVATSRQLPRPGPACRPLAPRLGCEHRYL